MEKKNCNLRCFVTFLFLYVMPVKINLFVSSQKQQHKGSRTPYLNHTFITRFFVLKYRTETNGSMINNIQYFNCQNTIKYFKISEKQFTIFIICCNNPRRVLQRCNVLFSGISWNVDNQDSNKPFQENSWS